MDINKCLVGILEQLACLWKAVATSVFGTSFQGDGTSDSPREIKVWAQGTGYGGGDGTENNPLQITGGSVDPAQFIRNIGTFSDQEFNVKTGTLQKGIFTQQIDFPALTLRYINAPTVDRWVYTLQNNETGSNQGSNLVLNACTDTGNPIIGVYKIDRATGVFNFTQVPQIGGVNLFEQVQAKQVTDVSITTDQTSASLQANISYQSREVGTYVWCPNITTGAQLYMKGSSLEWYRIATGQI